MQEMGMQEDDDISEEQSSDESERSQDRKHK